ncbi:MAG: toprim domain-containing protein [Clostridium sp.]
MSQKRMSEDIIYTAKQANLIDFMLTYHPNAIINRYGIRDREHDSLVLFPHSFCRFSTGEVNDGIAYLEKYQGYRWRDAVIELNKFCKDNSDRPNTPAFDSGYRKTGRIFYRPVPTDHIDLITNYLHNERGISLDTITHLLKLNKIYPATASGFGDNFVCFANHATDFYILRNISINGMPKLQFAKNPCYYWFFTSIELNSIDNLIAFVDQTTNPYTIDLPLYICESPIDAISLYEITKAPGIYAAMGGLKLTTATNMVSNFKNQGTEHYKRKTYIAVDNDPAGIQFANSFPIEIPHEVMTPKSKDWNAELLSTS